MEQSEKAKEKGNQAFQKGDYTSALKFYTVAIQLNNKNHVLYSNRSVTYLKLGDLRKALEDADTGIGIKGDWPKLYLRRLEALYELKDYQKILDSEQQIKSIEGCDTMIDDILNKTKLQIEKYYENINPNKDIISVEYIDPNKGKGIISKIDISKNNELFKESPFLLVQKTDNKKTVLACSHCLKFLGIRKDENSNECAVVPCLINPLVRCDHCSFEVYCSVTCKQSSWDSYHKLICFNDTKSPLFEYYQLANSTSHRFILVLRLISYIIITYQDWFVNLHGSDSYTKESFQDFLNSDNNIVKRFCKSSWLLMSQYDTVTKTYEHEEYEKQGINLKQLKTRVISDSLKLLKQVNTIYNTIYQPLYKPEYYAELIGLIDMNGANIEGLPVTEYRNILCDKLKCSEEEVPFSEGTGLFKMHSCLNHSCRPNAQVVGGLVDTPNATIKVVAIRNIKKGEEITISYIDEPNGKRVNERRKELKGCYLFQCNCISCKEEE